MNKFFKLIYKSKKSKARLGEIITSHGIIKTPAFVAVGTKGTIKSLTPELVKEIGTQTAFVNTYHLVTHPGVDVIKNAGGIHKYSGLNMPLMSDSGGFQVFSLANNKITKKADIRGEEEPLLVKITDDGVKFRSTFDGKLIEFTPEKSMEYQEKIGADINIAFDECTYYPATHEYAEKAMKRTHEWLKRCMKSRVRHRVFSQPTSTFTGPSVIDSKQVSSPSQYLYGVIQGATFEDLRKKSAEFVVAQNTDGVAIGGVSVGESKKEMREQVKWVSDFLPKDKPVHLLGVGQVDDIIDLVKFGIDTFDCVEPTRLARMGRIYQISRILSEDSIPPVLATSNRLEKSLRAVGNPPSSATRDFDIDILKSIYKNNYEKLDVNCNCYVCKNFTKSYLHHLFKQREILGYTLATYHNLSFMEQLFKLIRSRIENNLI